MNIICRWIIHVFMPGLPEKKKEIIAKLLKQAKFFVSVNDISYATSFDSLSFSPIAVP